MTFYKVRYIELRFSHLQDLPDLLRDLRLGPELEQPPGEAAARLEVLELEEEVAGRAEREHLVHGLQAAVREVRRHLARALLLGDVRLRELLAGGLHRQAWRRRKGGRGGGKGASLKG